MARFGRSFPAPIVIGIAEAPASPVTLTGSLAALEGLSLVATLGFGTATVAGIRADGSLSGFTGTLDVSGGATLAGSRADGQLAGLVVTIDFGAGVTLATARAAGTFGAFTGVLDSIIALLGTRASASATGLAGVLTFGGATLAGERAALNGSALQGSLGLGTAVVVGIRADGTFTGAAVVIDTGTFLQLVAGLRIAPRFSADRLARLPFTAEPRIREQLAGAIALGPEEP